MPSPKQSRNNTMSPYRDRYDQPVQTPTNNSWLNTAEVAELLGETQERIRVLAEHRLIPSTRRDHRFAYPRDQVELYALAYKARSPR